MKQVSLFHEFDRESWRQLRATTPLTLDEDDLAELQGIHERLSLSEVEEIYLPLSRLLNLYVAATQSLFRATDTFLGHRADKVPYVIGIAGSVAVGKSTTARILQALLRRWPGHPRVELVTTDGFLYPNSVLEERGLMARKGFPESYDLPRMIRFLAEVKAGARQLAAPVYCHKGYDIVAGQSQTIDQPDVVLLEGLNVLQTRTNADTRSPTLFVSDFFDFSIYVDAAPEIIEQWYVDRFLVLRQSVFSDPGSYFHRYADLSPRQATDLAREIWQTINGVNLEQNIQPTRERARLILHKGANHQVKAVRLRRL